MSILINDNKIESVHLIEIFKESLLNGQNVKIQLSGYSMLPFIKPGTSATIKKIDSEYLKIGNIVAYLAENKLIAHRIIKVNRLKNTITTKGDNNLFCDKEFKFDNYYGKIISLSLDGKEISLETKPYIFVNYILAKLSYLLTPFYKIMFKLKNLFN